MYGVDLGVKSTLVQSNKITVRNWYADLNKAGTNAKILHCWRSFILASLVYGMLFFQDQKTGFICLENDAPLGLDIDDNIDDDIIVQELEWEV